MLSRESATSTGDSQTGAPADWGRARSGTWGDPGHRPRFRRRGPPRITRQSSTEIWNSAKPITKPGCSSTRAISSRQGSDSRSHSRANRRTRPLPIGSLSAAWSSPRTYQGRGTRRAAASRSARVSPGWRTRAESNASTTTQWSAHAATTTSTRRPLTPGTRWGSTLIGARASATRTTCLTARLRSRSNGSTHGDREHGRGALCSRAAAKRLVEAGIGRHCDPDRPTCEPRVVGGAEPGRRVPRRSPSSHDGRSDIHDVRERDNRRRRLKLRSGARMSRCPGNETSPLCQVVRLGPSAFRAQRTSYGAPGPLAKEPS